MISQIYIHRALNFSWATLGPVWLVEEYFSEKLLPYFSWVYFIISVQKVALKRCSQINFQSFCLREINVLKNKEKFFVEKKVVSPEFQVRDKILYFLFPQTRKVFLKTFPFRLLPQRNTKNFSFLDTPFTLHWLHKYVFCLRIFIWGFHFITSSP